MAIASATPVKRFALFSAIACVSCLQPAPGTLGLSAEPSIASSIAVPRPDGPVSDNANIIPAADEVKLDAGLREIFDRTQIALIVVTVDSLEGLDVGVYTNGLARRWEVGGHRGGVVLLVAPNERQVRIETDDKVRARLSDQQASQILDQVILPRLRTGGFAAGIAAGVESIAEHL